MKGVLKVIQLGALVYALVCVVDALFLPSSVNLWFDNLFFPFAIIHTAYVFFRRKDLRIFIAFFLLLFGWSIISDWINSGRIVSDHVLAILYFLKWPAIIVSFLENKLTSKWKVRFDSMIDVVFIGLLGINLFILLNPGDLGMQLQILYSNKEYTQFIYFNEWGAFRLCGTVTSPNDNAAIFGLFALYYLYFRGSEKWYFILAALMIILFTQSRTALIALFCSGGVSFIKDQRLNLNKKKLIPLSLVVILALAALVMNSSNLLSLLSGEAFYSNSFMTRITNFTQFSQFSGVDRLTGYGRIADPVEQFGFYFDSEYVAILFQYGIIGLMITAVFYAYSIAAGVKKRLAPFTSMIYIYISLIGMTNFTFLNAKFGVIISLFLAYGFFIFGKNNNIIPENKPDNNP